MNDSVLFSHVMEEYGTHETEETEETADKQEKKPDNKENVKAKELKESPDAQEKLMQDEERVTGSVTGSIYAEYFRYAGGLVKIPIIVLLLTGYQGSQGQFY